MKIQIASDLHLEQLPAALKERLPTLIAPAPDADLLVLAGDIHNDVAAIDLFKGWPVPVLYIPGNHEFYGSGWPGAITHMRRACEGTAVTHHSPHPRSIDRFDMLKPVAAAYASDLTDLMGYSALWIHGHVHETADYEVHGTRVVCNPRGYLDPSGDPMSGWGPCFTIDI